MFEKGVLMCAFLALACGVFLSCDWDKDDDDDCGDNKYTLYSTATNSYYVYTEDYCKSIASDRGYKCYSYDSTNNRCYGYK